MAVGVVEVKCHVFTQPLTQAELQRVVVRSRDSRERRERSKLRLIEHVVELRRTTTERAGVALRTVVPEQLEERPVRDATAIERSILGCDERVSCLRWSQTQVFPPGRHVRKEVVEE